MKTTPSRSEAVREEPRRKILEVRHLELVSCIVEEGNLTRAGERLHLTQSALSHQLLDVEQRLGTPLFHRNNKRLTLTDAGQRLLTSARRILEDLLQTENDLRLYATHRRGTIRLTTECYTVYHWLPAVMKQFERKHPDVEIRIDVHSTNTPFESLAAGTIDVAFVTSESGGPGITLESLFEDELKVVVDPEHRLASKRFVTPAEIAQETLLTYTELKRSTVFNRLLRPLGLEPKKHMQVPLTEAIVELVRAGAGIGVLAQWAIAPYLAAGGIVAVPITRNGVARQWKAASLTARPMPPFLRSFIDMVAKEGPCA